MVLVQVLSQGALASSAIRAVPDKAEEVINLVCVLHHRNHDRWRAHLSGKLRRINIRVNADILLVAGTGKHEVTSAQNQITLVESNELSLRSESDAMVPAVPIEEGIVLDGEIERSRNGAYVLALFRILGLEFSSHQLILSSGQGLQKPPLRCNGIGEEGSIEALQIHRQISGFCWRDKCSKSMTVLKRAIPSLVNPIVFAASQLVQAVGFTLGHRAVHDDVAFLVEVMTGEHIRR